MLGPWLVHNPNPTVPRTQPTSQCVVTFCTILNVLSNSSRLEHTEKDQLNLAQLHRTAADDICACFVAIRVQTTLSILVVVY